jgi:hypothetical protein
MVELGWKKVQARSSILLCLLAPVGSGGPCFVKTAPSGKGDGKTVPLTGNYLAFEVNADGIAISGNFGSPRAIDFVQAKLTEVPDKPGIFENLEPKTLFCVAEACQVLDREGKTTDASIGDYIAIDNRGFGNVVKAEKFAASYTIIS